MEKGLPKSILDRVAAQPPRPESGAKSQRLDSQRNFDAPCFYAASPAGPWAPWAIWEGAVWGEGRLGGMGPLGPWGLWGVSEAISSGWLLPECPECPDRPLEMPAWSHVSGIGHGSRE